MASNGNTMASCTSQTSTMGTSNVPWANAEGLLEASIPGFSIISTVAKSYLHWDLASLLTYLVPIAALVAAVQYFYDPLSAYVKRYAIPTAEIRFDDEMYNYVMYWLSQQKFASNTLWFVAGTKTDSKMIFDYYSNDESDADRDQNNVETDWQLAEENFDQYWAQVTSRDRVKPLFYTPCDSTHYFKYQGQYIAFTRTSQERPMGLHSTRTETLFFQSLSRDTSVLKSLLREAQKAYIERDGASTIVYRRYSDHDDWQRCMARPPRPLSTVVLSNNQKEAIVDDIREYLHPLTKRWYANRGIPYRRGYLLYGPPGTGKTSLCVALAGMFRLKVYVASLNSKTLTEDGLATLFGLLPARCVVLLEDVDSAGITHKRAADSPTDKEKSDKDKDNSGAASSPTPSGISLSALLNIIDGVASSEGRILIMTTNHVEKLDPALLRPGRVDMSIAFENATGETARELFKSTYVSREEDYPTVPGSEKKVPLRRRIELSDDEIAGLADIFASKIPSGEFSPADIQGFLLKHKLTPVKAADGIEEWIVKYREEKARQRQPESSVEGSNPSGQSVPKIELSVAGAPTPPQTPVLL